jgi:hypothetical protein
MHKSHDTLLGHAHLACHSTTGSKLFFMISLIRHHQILRWALQMPTASSVITTTSMMLLPSIHGLHVHAKSFA